MLEKPFYTPQEAADALGVHFRSIYYYIKKGSLKASKFGTRTVRISKEDLEDFVNRHKMK